LTEGTADAEGSLKASDDDAIKSQPASTTQPPKTSPSEKPPAQAKPKPETTSTNQTCDAAAKRKCGASAGAGPVEVDEKATSRSEPVSSRPSSPAERRRREDIQRAESATTHVASASRGKIRDVLAVGVRRSDDAVVKASPVKVRVAYWQ